MPGRGPSLTNISDKARAIAEMISQQPPLPKPAGEPPSAEEVVDKIFAGIEDELSLHEAALSNEAQEKATANVKALTEMIIKGNFGK